VRASAATLGDVQVQIAAELALNDILLPSAQVRLVIAGESLSSPMETLQITR
jgi:multidrug efflux system outer membrane protein